MYLHRDFYRRWYTKDTIYFVTTKTQDNFPYFDEEIFAEVFLANLYICKEMKGFELYAFNLLPDHLHMQLKPNNNYNISKIMKSLKQNSSRDINNVMFGFQKKVAATPESRLPLGKDLASFRQRSFNDHRIRNQVDFKRHFDYTIHNHIRHKLSNDWEYTSLNFPELINDVDNF